MTDGSRTTDVAPVTVCRLNDVPEDGCLAVADGRVLLARPGGQLVAWRNRCLHRATPLDGGLVRDGVVTCPLHFWRYDLATGRSLGSGARLDPVEVVVHDGDVAVVPPLEPTTGLRTLLLEHARTWTRDPDPTEPT